MFLIHSNFYFPVSLFFSLPLSSMPCNAFFVYVILYCISSYSELNLKFIILCNTILTDNDWKSMIKKVVRGPYSYPLFHLMQSHSPQKYNANWISVFGIIANGNMHTTDKFAHFPLPSCCMSFFRFGLSIGFVRTRILFLEYALVFVIFVDLLGKHSSALNKHELAVIWC